MSLTIQKCQYHASHPEIEQPLFGIVGHGTVDPWGAPSGGMQLEVGCEECYKLARVAFAAGGYGDGNLKSGEVFTFTFNSKLDVFEVIK